MILGSIIAKALAMVDYVLGFFVLADLGATTEGSCANLATYNVMMTPCGEGIAQSLVGIIDFGLELLMGVFQGLLVTW
jgi:hypothetical protein